MQRLKKVKGVIHPPVGDGRQVTVFTRSWNLPLKSAVRLACPPLHLQPVDCKGPLNPSKIKIVGAKYLQVAQLVAQAKFVIRLQLVPVAGSADALKVLTAIWIAGPQSPDEPCRHDMVYMASKAGLFEIHAAGLHFAFSV
jgi:hypothetical protein